MTPRPHAGMPRLLTAPPELVLQSAAQGQKRVGQLVGALTRIKVDCQRLLHAALQTDSTVLHAEMAAWVKPAHLPDFNLLWSRFVCSIEGG